MPVGDLTRLRRQQPESTGAHGLDEDHVQFKAQPLRKLEDHALPPIQPGKAHVMNTAGGDTAFASRRRAQTPPNTAQAPLRA